jgi:outer membrane protein assembly factor BamB
MQLPLDCLLAAAALVMTIGSEQDKPPPAAKTHAGEARWIFESNLKMQVFTSPAIGSDGSIYIAGNIYDPFGNGVLFSIGSHGEERWRYLFADHSPGSPVIGPDGTIYLILSNLHELHAIDPAGKRKWVSRRIGHVAWSSPALASDGTIYVGSKNHYSLHAIAPDASEKWGFVGTGETLYTPVVDLQGTIYAGSWDNRVYAVDPTGKKRWECDVGNHAQGAMAIGADGTIYAPTWKGLAAISPSGALKWSFRTSDPLSYVVSTVAIGTDGTIYAGCHDKNVYAIRPDGTLRWKFLTGRRVASTPAIGSDGVIYIGSDDANLYAIDPDGSQRWAFLTRGPVVSSPAIDEDGTVYFGCTNGLVYAVHSSSKGLADSPWPMDQHDPRHTGRASKPDAKGIPLPEGGAR